MTEEEELTDEEELIYWIVIILYSAYIRVCYGGAAAI